MILETISFSAIIHVQPNIYLNDKIWFDIGFAYLSNFHTDPYDEDGMPTNATHPIHAKHIYIEKGMGKKRTNCEPKQTRHYDLMPSE